MNEMEARDLSDDLLLDNFHWSKTCDKYYDLFRAEILCRLSANKKSAPEDVQLDVELEKRIAEIRKRLSKVAEGPWFTSSDDASDSPPHKDSGLAMVDTGRSLEWPIARLCEWQNARFIEYAILDIPFLLEQLALLRRVSGKGAQARPKFATNDVEQRQIDIINLRLYARLAEENEWKDDVLHWSVFQQTLEAIATRLERLASPAPVPATPEPDVNIWAQKLFNDHYHLDISNPAWSKASEREKKRWNDTAKTTLEFLYRRRRKTDAPVGAGEHNGQEATTQGTPEGMRVGQGWIELVKKEPKSGEWCWVVIGKVVQRAAAHLSGDWWHWPDEDSDNAPKHVVSHWQYMQPAPAASQKGEEGK